MSRSTPRTRYDATYCPTCKASSDGQESPCHTKRGGMCEPHRARIKQYMIEMQDEKAKGDLVCHDSC